MAKKILAVYDSCPGYTERLLRYASRNGCVSGFEIRGFSEPDILEAALRDDRISAVLFSPENNNEGGDDIVAATLNKSMHEKKLKVMLLGEQPACYCEEYGFAFIDKYQKADRIFSSIHEMISRGEEKTDTSFRERKLEISGIYSPCDKCCHPELAAHIADMIRRKHRGSIRILYIELEQFSGMNRFLGLTGEAGLSNVIYYYRSGPEQIGAALKHAGSFGGMDILTGPADPEDLEEIGGKEWPAFLDTVFAAGRYQHIILGISVMDRFLEETVFQYGNLFIPSPEKGNRRAECRFQEYREYLKKNTSEKNLERIYEIKPNADR